MPHGCAPLTVFSPFGVFLKLILQTVFHLRVRGLAGYFFTSIIRSLQIHFNFILVSAFSTPTFLSVFLLFFTCASCVLTVTVFNLFCSFGGVRPLYLVFSVLKNVANIWAGLQNPEFNKDFFFHNNSLLITYYLYWLFLFTHPWTFLNAFKSKTLDFAVLQMI